MDKAKAADALRLMIAAVPNKDAEKGFDFWLVGFLPAVITWADGTTETAELKQKTKISYVKEGGAMYMTKRYAADVMPFMKPEWIGALLEGFERSIALVAKEGRIAGRPLKSLDLTCI